MENELFTTELISNFIKKTGIVHHQLNSYNRFVTHTIVKILTSKPVMLSNSYSIYFRNVVLSMPSVIEESREVRDCYPSEARNRDLTYSTNVCVDVIFNTIDENDNHSVKQEVFTKVQICKLPVMLASNLCHLSKMTSQEKVKAGECEHDPCGYFIIKGKERVLVSQLKPIMYNLPFIFDKGGTDKHEHVCEVRSISQANGHSNVVRVMIGYDERCIDFQTSTSTNPVPIGLIFNACGFHNLTDIMKIIQLNHPETSKYVSRILRRTESYPPHDCGKRQYCYILSKPYFLVEETGYDHPPLSSTCPKLLWEELTESDRLRYEREGKTRFALLVLGQKIGSVMTSDDRIIEHMNHVLLNEVFPHLGINANKSELISYVGHMLKKLLLVKFNLIRRDERDDYSNKRIETPGILCSELFKQLFKKFKDTVKLALDKHKGYVDVVSILSRNNTITSGFRQCFATGNWGVPKTNYIRPGVSQVMSRLSYGATLSHTRRISIPIGKESKNSKIRQINSSQIMYVCPCETPEGQSVGIVLNFAMSVMVSEQTPNYLVKDIAMRSKLCTPVSHAFEMSTLPPTRVFVNGTTIGYTSDSTGLCDFLRTARKFESLPYDVSVSYNLDEDVIHISSDSGRMIRPVLTLSDDCQKLRVDDKIDDADWWKLVSEDKIRYLDNREISDSVVAFSSSELSKYKYGYCEVSPILMFGILGSIIPWPDHSQSPRNCYQTSMGKQAMSMYSLAYKTRTDTVSHVLEYPQRPLVSTSMSKMLGFDDMPSGINAIVAIACYTGFNQEDSLILNKSAVERGLFNATSYRTHVYQEAKIGTNSVEKIGNPPLDCRKTDVNYGLLDRNGVIMTRFSNGSAVYVEKGDVVVGKYRSEFSELTNCVNPSDCSLILKKGEEGFVDRVEISITPDGFKMVKVVIRTERIPEVGDKFASRAAQKGTCGMIYSQEDMPWTSDGIYPDIIINPHCIPSRMTINQLMESVLGKTCGLVGKLGDATPFSSENSVNVAQQLSDRLGLEGVNGNGTEIMYSGFTGKVIGEVFIGPVYYQRLKHLVSEKIHARSTGPVTTLTRQPLGGRSRDGGLRFGEMERDCMISHGTSMFLKERLCDQSDPFKVDVCEECGCISHSDSKCKSCNNDKIFKVGIPYVSKLVLQELNAMCIKTSIKVKL